MGGSFPATAFQKGHLLLLIEHCIKKSPIHGLGVFTNERVTKGTSIWRFDPVLDRQIPEGELSGFPDHVQRWIKKRAQFVPARQVFILCADGDLFMNHSAEPNMSSDDRQCFALRDIAVGEEITCDYRFTKVLDFEPPAVSITLSEITEFQSCTPF